MAPPHYDRKDSFHRRAKHEGYRSRAAYKLLEIQKAHRLMRPRQRVFDLGCWPGGWLQVASMTVGPAGRVVGVDREPIDPPLSNENVVALVGDLTDELRKCALVEGLRGALRGRAEVLLCDAAPKLTGIRIADRAREEALLESVESLIPELLQRDGTLLLKLLEGPEATEVARRLARHFERAKRLRPSATRKGSTEIYLLARGYRARTGTRRPSREGERSGRPAARPS
ncbi:MAG: RlmE family RNA methyltransferase [Myxococcota bacterium]